MATKNDHFSSRSVFQRISSAIGTIAGNTNVLVGVIIITSAITASLVGPYVTGHDPSATNAADRFEEPSFLTSGEGEYLLGTDSYGRDLFTRTLLGGQTSLFMGLTSVAIAMLLAIPLGLVTGYYGGKVDEILMRGMDALISFPSLLLALLILATLSSNVVNAIIAVSIAYFPRIARVVRSATISVKNEEYVLAAEARSESTLSIMFTEIFPNILSPILVEGTIRIGFAILLASTLSFLGLGAQPPTPSWGYMVAQGRLYTHESVWYLLWPALALAITVTGFNLLGDGLRNVLDPQVTSDN